MNQILQKNNDFMGIYNKSYKLAAAVFLVSKVIEQDQELQTKIKKLSLELVSYSVSLKDTTFSDAKKHISNLEKAALELMSMLDIASVSGLVSKMNADILREEFQSFIAELGRFSERFENHKNVSLRSVFAEVPAMGNGESNKIESSGHSSEQNKETISDASAGQKNAVQTVNHNGVNHNGHRRKDMRKNTVYEFLKRHNDASIKDIVPNIKGCSEKTVQRELVALIREGKIKKTGERRWSRYSIA